MTSANLAALEADESLLQVYALQWRAIDLRAKQLRNQCRQVELDVALDREEHELLCEHEQLLRMKEKQLAQQQYEDRFKLSAASAAVRKLQVQTEQLQQRRESIVASQRSSLSSTVATVAVAVKAATKKPTSTASTTTTMAAAVVKRKSKEKSNDRVAAPSTTAATSNAVTNTLQPKPKPQQPKPKKKTTKSVTFSPRKPAATSVATATASSYTTTAAVTRRLEESFNNEDDDEQDANVTRLAATAAPKPTVLSKPVALPKPSGPPKPSAADELMRMLSADKASDSEEGDGGNNTTLADLLFSPAGSRPTSPRRGTTTAATDSANATPSKANATPSKLARSVAKRAMAAPLAFDFTRKAALAKARAAREQQQQQEEEAADNGSIGDDDGSDSDASADAETPSKKALKRRKDLGITFADKPAKSKAVAKPVAPTAAAAASNVVGGRSLMEMVGAASLVSAKQSKPNDVASAAVALSDPTPSADVSTAPAAAAATAKSKPKAKAKNDAVSSDAVEPESEDFAGLSTANITRRVKPKAAKAAASTESEMSSAGGATAKTKTKDKAKDKTKDKDKGKTKDKRKTNAKDIASAEEQTVVKADLLTRMTRMQDIATPQVAGKKTRKAQLLKKTGSAPTSFAAATRARFQSILTDGDAHDDNDDDNNSGLETPRKAPSMKRKRATDTSSAAPAAAAPTTSSYLTSPSVTALLAMRPSKSPIGIRYVPKPLQTPQSNRKRPRATAAHDDNDDVEDEGSGSDAARPTTSTRAKKKPVRATTGVTAGASLWGGSSASFFDAFVNGGAPRLKRSVVP